MAGDSSQTDPSNGSVDAETTLNVNDDLKDNAQKRTFRYILFGVFGGLSFCMLLGLFCELCRILSHDTLVLIASNQDWHASIFLVAVLVIFASVPLSIVLSLMKMSFSSKQKDDDNPILTTPQISAIQTILGFFKNGN